jgi:hypothetical protein
MLEGEFDYILVFSCNKNARNSRYLCEYTFFSSLSQDKSKALFIHVPELNKPFSADQLADGIKGVIKEILDGSNSI